MADQRSAWGYALVIPMQLAVSVAVGGALGYFLDRWLGSLPWGTIFFSFFGIAAGLYRIYRDVKRMSR